MVGLKVSVHEADDDTLAGERMMVAGMASATVTQKVAALEETAASCTDPTDPDVAQRAAVSGGGAAAAPCVRF